MSERQRLKKLVISVLEELGIVSAANPVPSKPPDHPREVPSEDKGLERTITDVLTSPIPSIVVGVLLTMDAAGDVTVKTYGIVFVCFWACLTTFFLLRRKLPNQYSWAIFFAWAVIIMFGWRSVRFLQSKQLEAFRADTMQHIVVTASLPQDGDPLNSWFQVTNNGAEKLHDLVVNCDFKYVDDAQGNAPPHNAISGISLAAATSAGDLQAFGDGRTDRCAGGLKMKNEGKHPRCLDIAIRVEYTIEQDKDKLPQKTQFRLISRRDDGYVWLKQPVTAAADIYCIPHQQMYRVLPTPP